MFQPQFYQRDHFGLHEQTFKSIKKCDEDIEKDLFQNVVLCGGSSLFLKIRKKFEKELQSLARTGKTFKVIALPERKYSSYLGGLFWVRWQISKILYLFQKKNGQKLEKEYYMTNSFNNLFLTYFY